MRKVLKVFFFILFFIFMMIEELILSPLRKIRIIFIEKLVKKWSAFWTITILVILKSIEAGFKFILPLVVDNTFLFGTIIILDGLFGFISMSIMIYGRDNLMTYRWYRKLNIFVRLQKRKIKRTSLYNTSRDFFIQVKHILHTMRVSLFPDKRGLFSTLKRYIRFYIHVHYKRRRRKRHIWEDYAFLFSKTFKYFASYFFSSKSEGKSSSYSEHGYKSYEYGMSNFGCYSYLW